MKHARKKNVLRECYAIRIANACVEYRENMIMILFNRTKTDINISAHAEWAFFSPSVFDLIAIYKSDKRCGFWSEFDAIWIWPKPRKYIDLSDM